MKKIFISIVLILSMIMTIFISAASGEMAEDPGMILNKYYTPVTEDSGTLTMELYSTGSTITITRHQPLAVTLVLDVSGSMSEAYNKTTKIAALKSAVNNFIDLLAADAAENDVQHKISIIKFAGANSNSVGNDKYWSGGYNYNYSQVVKDWTNASEATTLKTAVNALSAAGATAADYGMAHATNQLATITDSGYAKVCVMFTDGEPNHNNGFSESVANAAIAAAKSMKDSDITVYTIGLVGKPSKDMKNYMNYVSSNYPSATSVKKPGKSASTNFYKDAASADLTEVFSDIADEVLNTNCIFTETSVIMDEITGYFELPDGYTAEDVVVETAAWDGSAFGTRAVYENANVTIDGNKIFVTNFDFTTNCCVPGREGGAKLVITVPIQSRHILSGEDHYDAESKSYIVPSNTDRAGIYMNYSDNVAPDLAFPIPEVSLGAFKVYHSSNKQVDIFEVVPNFNIVNTITNKYMIYGGVFTDDTYATAKSYIEIEGDNGLDFTPVAKTTYYLKEVNRLIYCGPSFYIIWQPQSYLINPDTGEEYIRVTDIYALMRLDCDQYLRYGVEYGTAALEDAVSDKEDRVYRQYNLSDNTFYTGVTSNKGTVMTCTGNEKAGVIELKFDGYYHTAAPHGREAFVYISDVAFNLNGYIVTMDGVKVTNRYYTDLLLYEGSYKLNPASMKVNFYRTEYSVYHAPDIIELY